MRCVIRNTTKRNVLATKPVRNAIVGKPVDLRALPCAASVYARFASWQASDQPESLDGDSRLAAQARGSLATMRAAARSTAARPAHALWGRAGTGHAAPGHRSTTRA